MASSETRTFDTFSSEFVVEVGAMSGYFRTSRLDSRSTCCSISSFSPVFQSAILRLLNQKTRATATLTAIVPRQSTGEMMPNITTEPSNMTAEVSVAGSMISKYSTNSETKFARAVICETGASCRSSLRWSR